MNRVDITTRGPIGENLCEILVEDAYDHDETCLDNADVLRAIDEGGASSVLDLVVDNGCGGDILRAAVKNGTAVYVDGDEIPAAYVASLFVKTDFDCDFVEVKFADADAATAAERHFPVDAVNTGDCLAVRTRVWETMAGAIVAKLAKAELAHEVRASSLTEEDMWPEEVDDDAPLAPGM